MEEERKWLRLAYDPSKKLPWRARMQVHGPGGGDYYSNPFATAEEAAKQADR